MATAHVRFSAASNLEDGRAHQQTSALGSSRQPPRRRARARTRRQGLRSGSQAASQLERLEDRIALSVSATPAIFGTVYVDVNGNGAASPGEQVEAVAVQLARDTGDGIYTVGGDPIVATSQTDADGQYCFDSLDPDATYFVIRDAQIVNGQSLAATVSGSIRPGRPGTFIDQFQTRQTALALPPAPSSGQSILGFADEVEVIGRERDLFVQLSSGVGDVSLSVNRFGIEEVLDFNDAAGVRGLRSVTWDGVDGDAGQLAFNLGSHDLTNAGAHTGIVLRGGVDESGAGTVVKLRVYQDSAENTAEAQFTLPVTGGDASGFIFLPFSSFVGPASFTDVDAIEMIIEGGGQGADGKISLIGVIGPKRFDIPEVDTADLEVIKTNGVGALIAGEATNYFVTVRNNGPAAVTGARIVDTFRQELQDVQFTVASIRGGVTGATTNGDGTLNDVLNMPAGSSIVYSVTATVRPGTIGPVINRADIVPPSGVFDPNIANNTSTDTDPIGTSVDLQITKDDARREVTVGEQITYRIDARNNGPVVVHNARIRDIFPTTLDDLRYVSQGSAGTSGNSPSGTTNIDELVTIPVSGVISYVVTATVSDRAVGTLANLATIEAPAGLIDVNPLNNTESDVDLVRREVTDISITKTDGLSNVVPGQDVVYSIVVRNDGPSNAARLNVVDVFPSSLVDVQYSAQMLNGATGATLSGSGSIDDIVDLPAGATIIYTASASVAAGASGSITNTASVTVPSSDLNPNDNVATDTNGLAAQADLSVTKSDQQTVVLPGDALTYQIVVANNGPSDVVGARVTDVAPTNLTDFRYTRSDGANVESGIGSIDDLLDLADGQQVIYTVTATVGVDSTGSVTNTVTVQPPVGVPDPNPSNNVASDINQINRALVDVAVRKFSDPPVAVPGQDLQYTIIVSNIGDSAVPAARVEDVFDVRLTNVTYQSQAVGSVTGHTLSGAGDLNDVLAMPPGSSVIYTINATIDAAATQSAIQNRVSVDTGEQVDNNPTNNFSLDVVALQPHADLSITKTDLQSEVEVGQAIQYVVTVANSGPSDVRQAEVVDLVPRGLSGVTFTSSATGGATGNAASGTGDLRERVNLPVGSTITYVVSGEVDASVSGSIANSASIRGPLETGFVELDATNNLATDVNRIQSLIVLGSEPTVARRGAIAEAGQADRYQIVAHSTGKMMITSHFDHQAGDLDLSVFDDQGNVIAMGQTATNDEQLAIPVVSQQVYFINVSGANGEVLNTYDLEVENFPAPVPSVLRLTPASDTGMMSDDAITNSRAPEIIVQADLADFVDMGLTLLEPSAGTLPTGPGVAVGVRLTNLETGAVIDGFASAVGSTNQLFAFTPADASALGDAQYVVTAYVHVADGAQQDGQPTPNLGRSPLSDSYWMTIDRTPPISADRSNLLDSSDSGMSFIDNVTNKMRPALSGIGEPNVKVRVFAKRIDGELELVAQTVTTSDGSWQVTVDTLSDDIYHFRVEYEDMAGNVSTIGEPLVVEVDTTAPNTPFLDLTRVTDTGFSNADEVTNINELTFAMTTEDPGLHELAFNYKFRVYLRPDAGNGQGAGQEVLVYDSANDARLSVARLLDGLTDLSLLIRTIAPLPDGVHNFKLEVEDRAGNISSDFLLNVTIDTTPPPAAADLLSSSDSGMFEDDRVTNKMEPAFDGVSEVGSTVELFANGRLVGRTTAGSDDSDGVPGDGFGAWEITSEPLVDGEYAFAAHVEDLAGNRSISDPLTIWVDTQPPNVPFLHLLSDSGLSSNDRLTNVAAAEITITAAATTGGGANPFPNDIKYRVYDRPGDGSGEVLLIDSFGALRDMTDLGFFTETLPPLADGLHNLKVEIEDRAGNISHAFLSDLLIDTQPPVAAEFDFLATSDTGMSREDRVTKINEPAFTGLSTVGDQVRLYANGQLVGLGTVQSDASDSVPDDGLGRWQITSEPLADGDYLFVAEVEDLAGNLVRSESQTVSIDTVQPNQPYLALVDDSGIDANDGITNFFAPQVAIVLNDTVGGGENPFPQDIKYRIYDRSADGDGEILLVDSFAAAGDFVTDGQVVVSLPALSDGVHNLKLEVEDRAGNISAAFLRDVLIDTVAPEVGDPQLDLALYSDSGMSFTDNVTNIRQPAILGTGTVGDSVLVFANGEIVGRGRVGSDDSDGVPGDGFGAWEVTVEPLDDGVYEITGLVEDVAGNTTTAGNLTIQVDTLPPNTPFLDLAEASDTGRNNDDNVTNSDLLGLILTTTDPNAADHLALVPTGHNFKFRIYDRPESGAEQLIYDSVNDETLDRLDGLTSAALVGTTVELPEGWHNLKLEVEDRAGNISEDFLTNLLVDRTAFAGTVMLHPDSDSGVISDPTTFSDGITVDRTPVLTGVAEANSLVTITIDGIPAGTTVALPFDGDNALQPPGQPYAIQGNWSLESTLVLDDGVHDVVVTFEDPAGNRATREMQLVVDSSGPRIINITRFEPDAPSLFDPKPSSGPDPLIPSIVIHIAADAAAGLDAVAVQTAREEGHYVLVGDSNGNIPVTDVDVLITGAGQAQIVLHFASPLPDDRFTLTISDKITGLSGNRLDGESGAAAPFEGAPGQVEIPPIFPTGDGVAGGSFVGRFTVDSRPEIGTWGAGSVWIDTNGNLDFDPENSIDHVNRDIVYRYGFTSDDVFAGSFALPGETTDGFDKLAAYGFTQGEFRWLIDTDNDGVPNLDRVEPLAANGRPVAGNFDGNVENGDEVAVFDGTRWYVDTDHDYRTDTILNSVLIGYPIVGDFDGDGFDDLATWADNRYMLDLANGTLRGWDGFADEVIGFGFIGVRERPIAADMDQDGFADLGLWVPDREGQTDRDESEWYFLVSNGKSLLQRLSPADDPIDSFPVIDFTPVPFGPDRFAQFGDEFAEPIVGNFDPPTVISVTPEDNRLQWTNRVDPLDVNNDDVVSPIDALTVINQLNATGPRQLFQRTDDLPYLDTNADGFLSPIDALMVLNKLNETSYVRSLVADPVAAIPVAAGTVAAMPAIPRRFVEAQLSAAVQLHQLDRQRLEHDDQQGTSQRVDAAWSDWSRFEDRQPKELGLLTATSSDHDWENVVQSVANDRRSRRELIDFVSQGWQDEV